MTNGSVKNIVFLSKQEIKNSLFCLCLRVTKVVADHGSEFSKGVHETFHDLVVKVKSPKIVKFLNQCFAQL